MAKNNQLIHTKTPVCRHPLKYLRKAYKPVANNFPAYTIIPKDLPFLRQSID